MPTLDSDTDTFLDLVTESWDAPHCEAPHTAAANRVCTHTPVALSVAQCIGSFKACQAQVDYWASRSATTVCSISFMPFHECHHIEPLGG